MALRGSRGGAVVGSDFRTHALLVAFETEVRVADAEDVAQLQFVLGDLLAVDEDGGPALEAGHLDLVAVHLDLAVGARDVEVVQADVGAAPVAADG